MLALIISIAALLGAIAALVAVGLMARIGTRQHLHSHVWGMWEDCLLDDMSHRKVVKVPGQKRECLGCNQREVREVIAPVKR